MVYVADVDAFANQAIAAGAKVLMPVADQFYGDRSCKLQDPSGHVWTFATRIAEVPVEEMQRQCDAMTAS
jgi:PhnB protein